MLASSSDTAATKTALVAAFASTSLDLAGDSDALNRLAEYSTVFHVGADELASKFEATAIRSGATLDTDALLSQVQADLVREMDARIAANSTSKTVLSRTLLSQKTVLRDDGLMDLMNNGASQFSQPSQRSKVRVRGAPLPAPASSQSAPKTPLPAQKRVAATATVHAALQAAKQTPIKQIPTSSSSSSASIQSPAIASTPNAKQQPLTAPSIPFADRPNKAKLEEVFNAEVPLVLNSVKLEIPPSPVDISLPPGQQMDGYRYMFERLAEKGDLVDERIQELSIVLDDWIFHNIISSAMDDDEDATVDQTTSSQQQKDADDGEVVFRALQNPNIPHQETFYTAGRIVNENATTTISSQQQDSSADTSKITLESLYLETCRALGNGSRIQLQLSESLMKRGNVHFFPGQVIGLCGVNPSGRLLIVQDVFNVPRLEFATSRVNNIVQMYSGPGNEGRVINMMIAAGPFSVDAVNGDGAPSYEPLEEFGKVVCLEKPDVVVLCGPFVDEASLGWKGGYTMSSEGIMKRYVVPVLKRISESSSSTRIVLVPSTRGLESEWVGYPQPPIGSALTDETKLTRWQQFGIKELVAAGKVVLVPNPVQFMVNEIVVTVSNVDSLFHLNRDQLSIESNEPLSSSFIAKQDRMARLFQHHLTQRHLYPLSPPTLNPADKDPLNMNLFAIDSTRAQSGAITLQATPDLLILPSALKGMVRNVEGCVCVNPGTIVKGRAGGGSFARVCVHPLNVEELKGLLASEEANVFVSVGEKRKGGAEDGEEGGGAALVSQDAVLEHSVHSRCRVEVQKI